MSLDLSSVQDRVTNRLPMVSSSYFAGIIGDTPSQYAKSPSIWNPAFGEFEMDAVYLAFDVEPDECGPLVRALREHPAYLGGSVTVPFKSSIIDLLDAVDPLAQHIGAVNAIARGPDGSLIGYNTDGRGAVDALTGACGGSALLPELSGATVLLIGAGGAARATAFTVAERLGDGHLFLTNRTAHAAAGLAEDVAAAYGNASALGEHDIDGIAATIDLVVNASTRGQGGIRRAASGVTCLEPFSALAPADPPILADGAAAAEFYRGWLPKATAAILENNRQSLERVVRFEKAAFFDLVYFPLETVMLRHARLSGRDTLNGKWMNIGQAADAFVHKVCRSVLPPGDADGLYQRAVAVMESVW